jgi:hypothetical protein
VPIRELLPSIAIWTAAFLAGLVLGALCRPFTFGCLGVLSYWMLIAIAFLGVLTVAVEAAIAGIVLFFIRGLKIRSIRIAILCIIAVLQFILGHWLGPSVGYF